MFKDFNPVFKSCAENKELVKKIKKLFFLHQCLVALNCKDSLKILYVSFVWMINCLYVSFVLFDDLLCQEFD